MAFITENIGTILVTLVLAAVVILITVHLIRERKKGKSSCGCNCAHCRAGRQGFCSGTR